MNGDPFYRPVADRHVDIDDTREVANIRDYHARWLHGGLEVFAGWYGTENAAGLLITHAHRGASGRKPPMVVIRQTSAWRYDEAATKGEIGVIREVARETMAMLGFLGLKQNPQNATKFLSVVREHLGDLLTIPPKPLTTRSHAADLILTNRDTGEIKEMEVHDDLV